MNLSLSRQYIFPGLLVFVSFMIFFVGMIVLFFFEGDVKQRSGERSVERSSVSQARLGRSGKNSRLDAKNVSEKSLRLSSSSSEVLVGAVEGSVVSKRATSRVLPGEKEGKRKAKVSRVELGKEATKADSTKSAALHKRLMAEAFGLALKSDYPSKHLLPVAAEYYRRGEIMSAREVLIIAEKLAIDPDDPKRSSVAVREVVKAMLSMKQRDDALEALQNIWIVRERENAMAEVAAWSARHGDVEAARNILSNILGASSRDVALLAIADSEASYEGMAKAMFTAGLISNSRKKDDAYRRIAMKRAHLRDFLGAEQSVAQIRNKNIQDLTNAALARSRAQAGDLHGGLQLLKYVGNTSLEDTTLRELSTELAQAGRFSDSSLVALRIRDEKEKSYAIESMSVEQVKVGDLNTAIASVSSISVDNLRDRAWRMLSATAAQNGDSARARNVAVRIASDRERARAYRAIAQVAAKEGDHHDAYNTMQNISLVDEKALALVSMARYRLRQGDDRQAFSLLEDASRSVPVIAGKSSRDRVHAHMALVYAETKDSVHSLTLARKIVDPRRRDSTLGSLARTLAFHDDISTAQRSIRSISTAQVRLEAENHVARITAQRTQPQQALRKSRMLNSSRQRILFLLEVSRKC